MTTPTRDPDIRARFAATLNELRELRLNYDDPEIARLPGLYGGEDAGDCALVWQCRHHHTIDG